MGNIDMIGLIRRNWRTIIITTAIIVDITVIVISGVLAYYLRSFIANLPILPVAVFLRLGVLLGSIFLLFAMLLGVYRATFHSNANRQYFLAGKAYLFASLFSLAILYIFETRMFPRIYTMLFLLALPVIFIIGRFILNSFIRKMQLYGYGVNNILIAGYDNGGMAIIKRFKNFPELGYALKGIITNQKHLSLTPVQIQGTLFHDIP